MTRAVAWGGRLVLVAIALAWALSLLAGYDPVADVAPARASLLPGPGGPLGTDHMGRSVAWRLLTATQAFVGPGLLASLVALAVGLPGGALAGYLGGPVALGVRYAWTVVGALPRLVLVLLACSIYGAEAQVLAVAAGVSFGPALGEAVEARLAELRGREFVLATRAHGVSAARTLAWHLLWVGCRALVLRQLLFLLAFVLVLETSLSYIGGFGIEEPTPSWGNMLAFEFGVHDGNPWAWAAPALATWLGTAAAIGVASTLRERGRG
ncbi:hypothetical protein L6R53_27330 [Myxococcota bacterium]|nr:hypothetical protein [Myxococcota bacterium]